VETTETLERPDTSVEGAIANILQAEETEQPEEETLEEEATLEQDEEEFDDEYDEQDEGDSDYDDEEYDEDEESDDESDEDEDSSEEDTEDTEQAGTQAQSFTVKVDGKTEVVTLDELKQGYSGQKYVQKGMQEAAAAKKEAEAVYSALLQERQNIAQLYQQAQQGTLAQPPVEPARELFETDPIGYMDAKLKYDEQLQAYNTQMLQMEQVAQQQTRAEQAAQQAYLQQEMMNLQKIIPEFADQNKATEIKDKLITSGTELYGYEADEIAQVMDHRAIRVLHDAIKYQELMSGKEAAVEKAKPANRKKRPVKAGAKKGNNKSQVQKKLRQKLTKSGSVDDALALILES
jgi:hypothetical protein